MFSWLKEQSTFVNEESGRFFITFIAFLNHLNQIKMKNVKLTFALMAALAIGFASCEKDDDDDKPKDDGGSNDKTSAYVGTWESTINNDSFTLEEDGSGNYDVDGEQWVITSWEQDEVLYYGDVDDGELVDGIIIKYDEGWQESDFIIKGGGDTLAYGSDYNNTFVKASDDGSGDDGGSTMAEINITGYNTYGSNNVYFNTLDKDAVGASGTINYYLYINDATTEDNWNSGSPIKINSSVSAGDSLTIKGIDADDEIVGVGSYTIKAEEL